MDQVRTTLNTANANRPKGELANGGRTWSLATTDQLQKAEQYRPLIISYRNGAAVRLSDVATVTDSVEDVRTGGFSNGKPAILMIVFRQPNANIIETVDRVRALVPQFQASIPPTITLEVVNTEPPRSVRRSTTSSFRQ